MYLKIFDDTEQYFRGPQPSKRRKFSQKSINQDIGIVLNLFCEAFVQTRCSGELNLLQGVIRLNSENLFKVFAGLSYHFVDWFILKDTSISVKTYGSSEITV